MATFAANHIKVVPSLTAGVSGSSAGAAEGVAVDVSQFISQKAILVHINAPVASASDTTTFTVEHSYDGSTNWTSAAALLMNPDTGETATFTVQTDAVAVNQTLALKRDQLRRYVRVVATVAGTSIANYYTAVIIGEKVYTAP